VADVSVASPYEGRPVPHAPDWGAVTGWDIFLNNLSLGLFVVAAVCMLARPAWFSPVAVPAYLLAFLLVGFDLLLLVSDLGDSLRMPHMLRVAKRESPMSVGTWALSLYAFVLCVTAVLAVAGLQDAARVTAAVGLAPAAFGLLYKGVLFSSGSQPGWRDARWLGPLVNVWSLLLGTAMLLVLLVLWRHGGGDAAQALRAALVVLLVLTGALLVAVWAEVRPVYRARFGDEARTGVWLVLLGIGLILPLELALLGDVLQIVAALLIIVTAPLARLVLVALPHERRDGVVEVSVSHHKPNPGAGPLLALAGAGLVVLFLVGFAVAYADLPGITESGLTMWVWWVVAGLVAGAVGTWVMGFVMSAAGKLAARRSTASGDASTAPAAAAATAPSDPWTSAPDTAKVALKGIELLDGGREPDPKTIKPISYLMDYGYGSMLGLGYGVLAGVFGVTGGVQDWWQWLAGGLIFGLFTWMFQYATLVPMGIYDRWFWQYPRRVIERDLGYHLVFGYSVALVYAVCFSVIRALGW
jgi:hypothetical protein